MSNLAEIIAEVEKLPKRERMELFDRLIQMKCPSEKTTPEPYVLKPLPLGIRGNLLPSHLLEQIEEEEIAQEYHRNE
jgi:hypothetical protein